MRKRPNDLRGEKVRRMLLAMVRACAARGRHIPKYTEIALSMNISCGQVSRHMAKLMDDGAFSTRSIGRRTYAFLPAFHSHLQETGFMCAPDGVSGSSDYRNEVGL